MKPFLRSGLSIYFLFFLTTLSYAKPNGVGTVQISVDSVFGIASDSASVAIRVRNFTDILSMQGSINWDPAQLTFSSTSNFGLPYFDDQSVGTTETDQGKLRFIWTPDDGVARDLPDSTIIFRVNFKVLAEAGDNIEVRISDDPLPVEFGNSNYQVVDSEVKNGNVEVFGSRKDVVEVSAEDNTSCDVLHPNGTLMANVFGDTINYRFLWYYGNDEKELPDLEGPLQKDLKEGNYTLAVYDTAENVFAKTFTLTINLNNTQPTDQISLDSLAMQKSCTGDAADLTGYVRILVNDSDSDPDINLFWYAGTLSDANELSQFKDSYVLSKLDAGDYLVRALNNHTGCAQYDTFAIATEQVYPENQIVAKDDSLLAPAGASYDWYRNDVSLGTHTSYLKPTKSGYYSVEVTSGFGCATKTEDTYFGVTGLEDNLGKEIAVFPNPFVDRLTIQSSERLNAIELLNTSGQRIFLKNFDSRGGYSLDLSSFPKGIYLLKIGTEKSTSIEKIIKH